MPVFLSAPKCSQQTEFLSKASYRPVRSSFLFDKAKNNSIHYNNKYKKKHRREYIANHCAGIVKSMQEHSDKITGCKVPNFTHMLVAIFTEFGPAIKYSHKNRKAHMPRNRKKCPRHRNRKAISHNIANILECCKTKGNKNGINNAIKAVIKIRIIPCPAL